MNRPRWELAGSALAIAIVLAGLLWHVLACTESPMAFSPDGKNLVFTVLQPYETKGGNNNTQLCRLMVLTTAAAPDAKNLRTLEEGGVFLTGPSFSPDGTQFCYLRIAVPEAPATAPATPSIRGSATADAPATAPALPPGLILPGDPKPGTITGTETIDTGYIPEKNSGQALLVVRDSATFKIVSTVVVDFSFYPTGDELAHPYLTLRPQYGASKNNIFYTDPFGMHAIDLQERSATVINRRAMCPAISPDHKTLAFVGSKEGKSVVLFTAELASQTERFFPEMVSPSGLFWINNDKLAVLTGDAKNGHQKIVMLARDGKPLTTMDLPEYKATKEEQMGELAISPDGQHMIVCYNGLVRFFDAQGKLQHDMSVKDALLAQPTITPDGARIAFKELTTIKNGDTEVTQVSAIVFYNFEAKEVARVAIAPAPAPR